jgi:hypothetical protein
MAADFPPEFPYARGKLFQVCAVLATNPGDARTRVGDARQYLGHIAEADLPAQFRPEYLAIVQSIDTRRRGPPHHGYRWTNKTAAQIARRIWDFSQ